MVCGLAGLIVLLSCSRSNAPAAKAKISLGYVSTGLSGLAVEAMREQSIPERHGLQIEYQGFANPQALNQAFFLDKVNVNLAAGANVVASQAGTPPRFLYLHPTLLNSVSLLVKTGSSVNRLGDLRGKRVGWYGPLSGGGTGLMALCEEQNLGDCRIAFQMVQTTPGTEALLLERGDVEAAIAFEPIVGKLLSEGKYRRVLGPFWQEWEQRTGVKMEMAGLAVSTSWFAQNGAAATTLVKVWHETVDYLINNFRKVLETHVQLTGLSSEAELKYGVEWLPPVYVRDWGTVEESIKAQVAVLKQSGLLTSDALDFVKKR